jgi:4-hydroxy-tetrahydrodipicolinate synthase
MVTPVTGERKADLEASVRLARSFIQAGVYPFIFGTTGEASGASMKEKIRMTEALSKEFGAETTLYAGVSDNCAQHSVELAKAYAKAGVRVVVAHLPHYYQLQPDDMRRYFELLAREMPIPLIIYNIPATTHMSIPLEVVEQLSRHPNIVGLKDSERDFERHREAIRLFKDREDFSHLVGWAAKSAECLELGSDGIVPSTGNIVPVLYKRLYDAARRGAVAEAMKLQEQTEAISKIYQTGRSLAQSIAALKIMLHEAGLCETHMWPPLEPPDAKEQADLRAQTRKVLDENRVDEA